MIIAGAGGFAKELYSEWKRDNPQEIGYFFDDVNNYQKLELLDTNILTNEAQIKQLRESRFILGTGSPNVRRKLWDKMITMGLKPNEYVSQKALLGQYGIVVETGSTIMAGSILTTCIQVGYGTLINIDCTIGHDTTLGPFCEICPGVHISGGCTLGNEVFIGTGAVILPGVTIGSRAIVAAGAVVTADVPENSMVAGVPAQIRKQWQTK